MAKPFDATLKGLIERYPVDWLTQLGLPAELPVRAVDTDLSTVSTQADKVFRVGTERPWLLHLELQASRDAQLAERMLRYNVLLHERHQLPVHSVVVLLRRAANVPGLNGVLEYGPIPEHGALRFQFQVVRLWRAPAERFLTGGAGTLPLTPLCNVEREGIPEMVQRLSARLDAELPPAEADSLRLSTYILMGLRYPAGEVAQFWSGVRPMRESATYQSILDEGRSDEARQMLIRLGQRRFGAPDARTRELVNGIQSVARLEELCERVLDAAGWDELLRY